MKHLLASCCAVVLAASSLILCSCGKEKETLHIYNWGNYMSDDVIAKFEKENDCKIVLDLFDSNESMYAKLKAGAGGYDLVVPSSYTAFMMNEQNMLEHLDHSKIPNVDQYFDKKYSSLSSDKEMAYTVPYFVSFTGIGYNAAKVQDFKPTWKMFERSDLKGRTTLLNDPREVIGCALRAIGIEDVNSTDQAQIDKAIAQAKIWKTQIAKFGVDDAVAALASGEFYLVQNYSGDVLQAAMENPDVRFVIPEEGSTVTFDNFAIMKDSAHKDLAYKFINFIYRPEICAENMNVIQYVTPHKTAVDLVDDELKNNPAFTIPEADFARCVPLRDMGEKNTVFNKAWDRIREE